MEATLSASPALSRAAEERESMAQLQDAVPQLESLFVLTHCIGNGTFSSVYLARTKHNTTINGRRHFAIKHIIPTSHPSRVFMELKCLRMIGGVDYVMGVTMCFRQMNHIVLVMPHFPHDSFSDYVGCMSTEELREYLVALLMALRRVHSFNIIHRDVKPANFLYNRKHRRYSLVDFGLAQEVGQTRGYSRSSAGRGAAKDGMSVAKAIGQGRGAATKLSSPPVIDTPLAPTTRTVKRKLGVTHSGDGDDDGERTKCPRQVSSPVDPLGGILTSTSNRLNNALRRSPRKQSSILVSPKKENYDALMQQELKCTPQKKHLTNVVLEDSPSKHTRGAEACRKLDSLDGGDNVVNATVQIKGEPVHVLRRSPRKPVSRNLTNMPLEGLLKQLSQVTVVQEGSSYTPVTKMNKSKTEVSSCELLTVRNSSQRQRHGQTGAAVSPRVSGLTLTPDLHPITSKAIKTPTLLHEVKTKSGSMLCPVSCHCYGSAKVCGVCVARSNQVAPRAGTPGFRAPEVLLRHPNQGTGLDMWSVGVIMLSLLSGRYPFFRAADDLSTLAEITTLLGTSTIRKAAARMDKLLTCSEERVPLDLMKVCETLRNNSGSRSNPVSENTSVGHVCPGCRQRGICVCLVPPTLVPTGHTAHSSKKRSSSQDLNKRNHKTTLVRPASPKKRSKNGSSHKIPGLHLIQCPSLPPVHTITVVEGNGQSIINRSTIIPQVDRPLTSSCLENDSLDKPALLESNGVSSKDSNGKCAPPAYPTTVYHLLMRLLDPDPDTRISAEDALAHPFLAPSP